MTGQADQTERMARLFDSLASDYDNVGVEFFRPIAAQLVDALQPRSGETWLDIGCGRGAVLLQAAAAIGPTGVCSGFDLAPAMVEACRSTADVMGLTNVDVYVDNAQHPQARGTLADVVSSSLVLFFLPEPDVALGEWRALLKPGGRLGVTTFAGTDPRWQQVDGVFEPFLPPALRDARTSGASGPFASDEGMEALVSAAGFEDVHTVTGAVPVRFANTEQWHEFTWSVGQRAMWLAVPEEQRPSVRAEAEERLAEHAGSDGVIEFEQPVRHTLARRPR